MFTKAVSAFALALCPAASIAPAIPNPLPGTINSAMPPVRYQGGSSAIVIFTSREGIAELCGVPPPRLVIIACAARRGGVPIVAMPNPCPYGDTQRFAKIMCHEMGHVQGWSGRHED